MKTLKNYAFVGAAILALICVPLFAQSKGITVGNWTFENQANGTCGWELATAEFYMYKGPAKLSWDNSLGKGLLRLDVDFTNYKDLEWSEVKMFSDFPKSFQMRGKTKFTFDFYYNPSLHSKDGHFKAKVFANNNGFLINSNSDEITGGTNAGNGFVKVKGEIPIKPVSGFLTDMRFSIAGYMTAYKGAVFFDNLRWE
ncbi:MAG: hypothetical protein LBB72_03635 [Spirochaetaceae bacterium]|jgi:hypothetical protein|nr:hypothetical protein [Spirochaetaceae bacterium]